MVSRSLSRWLIQLAFQVFLKDLTLLSLHSLSKIEPAGPLFITRPAHFCLATFCAPLLRFCSLQRLRSQGRVSPRLSVPGTLRSCAFSSLQRFSLPVASRVYFTSKHSWASPSELSPARDWLLLPARFCRVSEPLPPFIVGCYTLMTSCWSSQSGFEHNVAVRF